MRTRLYARTLAAAALLLLAAPLTNQARAAEIFQGQIVQIRGDVEIRKRLGKNWIKAAEGMRVDPGDQIQAGIDGHASLKFKDNQTEIHPLSQLVVGRCFVDNAGKYTELFLQIGKLDAKVENRPGSLNKFNIVTPTSVAGVRGTRMSVSHYPDLGTNVQVRDNSGYVTLVATSSLPPQVLPILGYAIAKTEKSDAGEDKKLSKEEGEKDQEKSEKTKTTKDDAEKDMEKSLESVTEGGVVTGEEASAEKAVELFNEYLEKTEDLTTPEGRIEQLNLLDESTFEYVITVDDGQRLEALDPADPTLITEPADAQVADAQTDVTPEGMSDAEDEASQTEGSESGDAPESVQAEEDVGAFQEATEDATATSTSLGGIPPSSSIVPPALPDRTGRSNLSN